MANEKLSIAQLKRDAKEGAIMAQMVIWHGKEITDADLPERLRGKRRIVGCNTVALMFENPTGEKPSELHIPRSNLMEYTKDSLTIYYPGYRRPNEEEQRVLDEWKQIESTKEYQERFTTDCLTDGSSTYWQKVRFFKEHKMEYLMGFEKQNGLYVDLNLKNRNVEEYIRDDSICSDKIEIKYILSRES